VSPVKYKLGFYFPEDDIPHSHSRENLNSYMANYKSNSICAGFRNSLVRAVRNTISYPGSARISIELHRR
jgi:hypothetical protein